MQRHIVHSKRSVVGAVGEVNVDAATHYLTLVEGAVIVGAKNQHAAVVAADGRVIFIAAREACRFKAIQRKASVEVIIHIFLGQRREERFHAVHIRHQAAHYRDEMINIHRACGQDTGEDHIGQHRVDRARRHRIDRRGDDVAEHEGLQLHCRIAVGHRAGLLTGLDKRQVGVNGNTGHRFVHGIRQIIPSCRGGITAVHRHRDKDDCNAVARVRGPLLEAAMRHGHAHLCAHKTMRQKRRKKKDIKTLFHNMLYVRFLYFSAAKVHIFSILAEKIYSMRRKKCIFALRNT